jgi:osmotically-inducible protein OsmY
MRRYHSWLAALGFAAATPGLALAGPLSLFSGDRDSKATAEPDAKAGNQKTANDIAKALRAARLNGYNIEVEYKGGVATLIGEVPTAQQRDMAAQVTRQVPGVKSVTNQLSVKQVASKSRPAAAAPTAQAAATRRPQAAFEQSEFETARPSAAASNPAPSSEVDNQAMADRIAGALRSSRFAGQGVEIQFQEGVAMISGAVADPQRRSDASAIISRVPGVKRVDNQLEVVATQRRAARPIQQVQYDESMQGGPMDQPLGPPMTGPMAGGPMQGAPQGGGYPAYPAGAMMPQGGPPGGPGGPQPMYGAMAMNGSNPAIYDQPNMPEHAWPAYASHPNYAAVTYPKQYSASAWPYIGPFYPYPQVPLGWRKVQLEWDDGYWQLNFRARTERWWWFMDYRNW